nr:hypothetical protein [uncultured Noviherbaspirillum sp.]
MNTFPYALISRCLRCFVFGIAMLILAACNGGGTSNELSPSTLSITDARSGAALAPDATLFGLSKIAIAGVEPSTARVEFNTEQNATRSLIPDPANPGEFWMPVVLASTNGTLSISPPEGAPHTLPVTLMPFKTSGAPGAETQAFLQSSLSTTNAAINDLRLSRPLPDLLQALQSATDLTQQALTWVTNTAQNGRSSIARRKDGSPVELSTKDLQVLDQMVLYTDALRINGGALPAVAHLSRWIKLVDYLVPSAFAQTTDKEGFIGGAKATGDALGLTGNIGQQDAEAGIGAFYPGADVQVISLTMRALYATYYGTALATIQTLPNLTFVQPVDQVQVAAGQLFAGAVNEITKLDMAGLTDDAMRQPIRNFTDSIDRPEVENILKDMMAIFRTATIGISLCPAGEIAVADPEVDSVRCQ